jgi:hypothetical protein
MDAPVRDQSPTDQGQHQNRFLCSLDTIFRGKPSTSANACGAGLGSGFSKHTGPDNCGQSSLDRL